MARARFIRPEFFADEKVGELPAMARLLFVSIWCQSDLRGVFEWSPKQLRVASFPHDEGLTSAKVEEWMGLLANLGMIARFEAGGKFWGHVVHWNRHQSISGREAEIDRKQSPQARRPSPPPTGTPSPSPGDDPGTTRGRPGDDPGSARVASPSPSPSPSPTPPPSGSVTGEGSPPPAGGDGDGVVARVQSIEPHRARGAVETRDPLALVSVFGGTRDKNRDPEWLREADGLQLGVLAAILWDAVTTRSPIRQPSGLRAARERWRAKTPTERAAITTQAAEFLGLRRPGSPAANGSAA